MFFGKSGLNGISDSAPVCQLHQKRGVMYMKAKRTLAFILAALFGMSVLGGCGGGNGKTSGKAENGKIQLTMDSWPSEDADPKAYANAMRKKEEFEKKYPDIEVKGESWAYEIKTFTARAEGGTLPVLYRTHFTEADKIIKLGYSADITEYVKKYGYYGKINETILDKISDNGKIYLLPKSAYTLGLVINMNLFRQAGLVNSDGSPKAPKTFDELAEFAEIIKSKTGKAGFAFPTTNNQGGWLFTMLAWNYGGEFIKEENGKLKSAFASAECEQALNFLGDLKWNKDAMPANTVVNLNEIMKLIGTDQAAMTIMNPADLGTLMLNYGMKQEDIAVVNIPSGPKKHVTLMGGAYYAIANNAAPEQIDAAFKWLQFDGLTTEMDDEAKERYEKNLKATYDSGNSIIGIKDISIWNDTADVTKFKNGMMEKYRNIPIENVRDYNDKNSVEFQTEEETCAQDLYNILDRCIQETLTNKGSDSKGILEKAASDFQNNFLNYEN